jgi:hypothetical protein
VGNPQAESEAGVRGGLTRPASGRDPWCQEKPLASRAVPVPQTDTGGLVEHTKVDGRTLVKELGNLTP